MAIEKKKEVCNLGGLSIITPVLKDSAQQARVMPMERFDDPGHGKAAGRQAVSYIDHGAVNQYIAESTFNMGHGSI